VSADADSFQAHLSGISCANFKAFMQQVYGDSISTSDTNGHDWGTPGHIYYRAADIGVAIEYFGGSNEVIFICHRGHAFPLL
jgi:hypothetical protein